MYCTKGYARQIARCFVLHPFLEHEHIEKLGELRHHTVAAHHGQQLPPGPAVRGRAHHRHAERIGEYGINMPSNAAMKVLEAICQEGRDCKNGTRSVRIMWT